MRFAEAVPARDQRHLSEVRYHARVAFQRGERGVLEVSEGCWTDVRGVFMPGDIQGNGFRGVLKGYCRVVRGISERYSGQVSYKGRVSGRSYMGIIGV